ncbi:MAG: hypothetical protein U7127_13320 [Phormidium sp.]
MRREANQNNTRLEELDLPKLWIITPTASDNLRSEFVANYNQDLVTGIGDRPSLPILG